MSARLTATHRGHDIVIELDDNGQPQLRVDGQEQPMRRVDGGYAVTYLPAHQDPVEAAKLFVDRLRRV